jgi:hypothetical protein
MAVVTLRLEVAHDPYKPQRLAMFCMFCRNNSGSACRDWFVPSQTNVAAIGWVGSTVPGGSLAMLLYRLYRNVTANRKSVTVMHTDNVSRVVVYRFSGNDRFLGKHVSAKSFLNGKERFALWEVLCYSSAPVAKRGKKAL